MEEKDLKALKELAESIDAKLKEYKEAIASTSRDEAQKALGPALEKELKKYNELIEKMQKQLDAIDTKMQRVGQSGADKPKGFMDHLKEFMKGKTARQLKGSAFEYEVKADDMTQANSFESTIVVPVDYRPGIYYDPTRPVHVRDLISQATTNSNMVSIVREYAYTDAADVTTEGAEYKQEDVDLKRIDAAVIKITNYMIVSEEMLEDVDGLTSYLSTRLPEKLRNEEDDQILNHATYGILTLGTAYVDNLADADITRFDVLVDACRQVIDDEYRPTAILLHPTDATLLKLAKDDNGQYVLPYIFMNGGITVDGVPVIVSTAITSGKFLVGDFKRGCTIFDRRQLAVEFSNSNEDNFIKGMVTVRGSERIAIGVHRPKAFVYGTFAVALAQGTA